MKLNEIKQIGSDFDVKTFTIHSITSGLSPEQVSEVIKQSRNREDLTAADWKFTKFNSDREAVYTSKAVKTFVAIAIDVETGKLVAY